MTDKETRPYISWELVGNFMVDAFQAAGLPKEDAEICADVLMESDRRVSLSTHVTGGPGPLLKNE